MDRDFDEALLAELLIERLVPLVEQAKATKGGNAGAWERLLRDLTQTDPKMTFQNLKDDQIFQMITGFKDFERRTVIGGSKKPKLNQAILDRARTIKGFESHHIFGLDENQMITMLMTKPSDLAGVSAVRRANDRVAYFQTQRNLGRKSGTDMASIVSEARMTHAGGQVPGKGKSLSQAASYHPEGTKVPEPFKYEVGMENPEAAAMEFYQTNEQLAQRSAVLQDPNTPTYSNRIRALREQTIQRSDNPVITRQMWAKGEFDKLDKLYPDLGIAQTYQEGMMPGARTSDRLVKPGEVVDPLKGNLELAGMSPGKRGAARLLGKLNDIPLPIKGGVVGGAMTVLGGIGDAIAGQEGVQKVQKAQSPRERVKGTLQATSGALGVASAVAPNPLTVGGSAVTGFLGSVMEHFDQKRGRQQRDSALQTGIETSTAAEVPAQITQYNRTPNRYERRNR